MPGCKTKMSFSDPENFGVKVRLPEHTELLRSSYQIGDGPVIYGQSADIDSAGHDLAVLVGTMEVGSSEAAWLNRVDGLDLNTTESDESISLLAAMAGKGTHHDGTQSWMEKPFLTISKRMKTAEDGDIQLTAVLCSSRYEKLAKEQATKQERVCELLDLETAEETCEKTTELTKLVVSKAKEMETFIRKIVGLAT